MERGRGFKVGDKLVLLDGRLIEIIGTSWHRDYNTKKKRMFEVEFLNKDGAFESGRELIWAFELNCDVASFYFERGEEVAVFTNEGKDDNTWIKGIHLYTIPELLLNKYVCVEASKENLSLYYKSQYNPDQKIKYSVKVYSDVLPLKENGIVVGGKALKGSVSKQCEEELGICEGVDGKYYCLDRRDYNN